MKKYLCLSLFAVLLFSCEKESPALVDKTQTTAFDLGVDDRACTPISVNALLGVKRYKYAADDARQILDLYLPTNGASNPKVVFLIHGGGWVMGPTANLWATSFQSSNINLVAKLRASGYACAVVKYRLAKYSHNDPAQLQANATSLSNQLKDIDSAIKYVENNAACLGVSGNAYAILGESAGGHLALQYAYTMSNPAKLKTVVSFYAPTDMQALGNWAKNKSCPNASAPCENFATVNFNYFLPVINNAAVTTNINPFSSPCVPKMMDMYNIVQTIAGKQISNPLTDLTLKSISPKYSINATRNIPTFALHGAQDRLVPLEAGQDMSSTLSNWGPQHQTKTYTACGHGWENQVRIWNGACNFNPINSPCARQEVINDVKIWLQGKL